jgi:hypothetical protein
MYKIKSFADPHTFNNVEEQAHYLATLLADNQIDDHKFSEILVRGMTGEENQIRFLTVMDELETILAGEEFGPSRGMTTEKIEEIINSLKKACEEEKERVEDLPGHEFRLAMEYGATQEYDEDGVFLGGVYSWDIGLCIKIMHMVAERTSYSANREPESDDIISFNCYFDGRPELIYYPDKTAFVVFLYDTEGNIANINPIIDTLINIISTEANPVRRRAAVHVLGIINTPKAAGSRGAHCLYIIRHRRRIYCKESR